MSSQVQSLQAQIEALRQQLADAKTQSGGLSPKVNLQYNNVNLGWMGRQPVNVTPKMFHAIIAYVKSGQAEAFASENAEAFLAIEAVYAQKKAEKKAA